MAALAVASLPAAAPTQPARGRQLGGAALARALQQGRYVLVVRHAHAPATPPTASDADPRNPARADRWLQAAPRAGLTAVGKYDNAAWMQKTRPISWIKAARKDFDTFPAPAREKGAEALTMVAEGGTPDIAKPLAGLGSGVWELAIRAQGDAFRVVYVLQLGDDIWVIHAFQKKSKTGIATPKVEIDLIKERIKRLKEALK